MPRSSTISMRDTRILIVALAAIILFLFLCVTSAQAATPLHFNDDGTFKIMVIADIQDGADVSALTLKLMRLALDREKPDLVVLDGDNIFRIAPSLLASKTNVRTSIDRFVQPIVERGIPFAVVFGNQDFLWHMSPRTQMAYYQTFEGCLSPLGQIGSRVGNYNLLVADTTGTPALNLWFVDSGDMMLTRYGFGYALITDEQIQWYEDTARELAAANGGTPLPAVLFQHIPVTEIYALLIPVAEGTPDAIRGSRSQRGEWFALDPTKVTSGSMGGAPTAPDFNSGQFASWVAQGDVMAAVFGHAHVNDFVGTLDGIELMYTPGVGFYAYGNGTRRGVRILEFDQNDVRAYSTRVVYWEDLTDESIPNEILYDGAFMHGDIYFYYSLVLTLLILLVGAIVACIRKRRSKRLTTRKVPAA